jgi:hypothetical protein
MSFCRARQESEEAYVGRQFHHIGSCDVCGVGKPLDGIHNGRRQLGFTEFQDDIV